MGMVHEQRKQAKQKHRDMVRQDLKANENHCRLLSMEMVGQELHFSKIILETRYRIYSQKWK